MGKTWTNVAGTWQESTQPWINVSGTNHDAKPWINVAGTWQEAFGEPLSVSVPGSFRFSPTTETHTLTATPSGGTTPYTYAWTKVSGSGSITGSTTTSSTTVSMLSNSSGTYRCTVTDNVSDTAFDDALVETAN